MKFLRTSLFLALAGPLVISTRPGGSKGSAARVSQGRRDLAERPFGRSEPRVLASLEEACRVEVRFSLVEAGFYHAFIVASDRRGATYFRAGPVRRGSRWDGLWAMLRGPSAEIRHWGSLVAQHGPLVPGSIDYDAGIPDARVGVLEGRLPCSVYNLLLSGAELRVNSARIPYHPFSTNSNSYVRYALRSIHVDLGAAPVRAPGWETEISP